jgi:prepilin-type processing-associated H-X9-DG protein
MNRQFKTNGLRELGGFTLLELILVTGLILVLAGLLLPALIQVKAKASEVRCINQLHQVDLALEMFSDDHGNMPRSFVYRGGRYERRVLQDWLVPGYLGNPKVFWCSSDPSRKDASKERLKVQLGANLPVNSSSYTYNDLIPDAPARARTSTAPLLWDEMAWHSGGLNLVYYDGSIKRLEEGTFGRVYFNWYTIISRPDP